MTSGDAGDDAGLDFGVVFRLRACERTATDKAATICSSRCVVRRRFHIDSVHRRRWRRAGRGIGAGVRCAGVHLERTRALDGGLFDAGVASSLGGVDQTANVLVLLVQAGNVAQI